MNTLTPEDLQLVQYYREVLGHEMRLAKIHLDKSDKMAKDSPQKMAHLQASQAIHAVVEETIYKLAEILGVDLSKDPDEGDILVKIDAALGDGNYRLRDN